MLRHLRTITPLLAACSVACVVHADVKLPAVLSSGMVVQRNSETSIWGWARPGERVVVSASWLIDAKNPSIETTTPASGCWSVKLKTPDAGGPYVITAKGDTAAAITDVLSGELWLVSGQSNMEWPLAATENGPAHAAGSANDKIRFFTVKNTISLHPLLDVDGKWAACSPDVSKNFSAVGFHFAHALNARLGVPIGIIASDWGGTPVESWMPESSLRALGEFTGDLDRHAALRDPSRRDTDGTGGDAWWNALDGKASPPLGPNWSNQTGWSAVTLPSHAEGDLARFDGVLYYKRTVTLPEALAGRKATLSLGPIDDRDDAYINGVHVGSTRVDGQWNRARRYSVAADVLKAGENTIAVRVLDTGGLGGFGGTPDSMSLTIDGVDGPIPLAGDWQLRAGAAMSSLPPIGQAPTVNANSPTTLYNGMIAPLTGLKLAGVLWYQGESNTGNAAQYRRTFPGMIEAWRKAFNAELPFYYVQIAPYTYTGWLPYAQRPQMSRKVADLRESQRAALSLPKTGMIVTTDIGDADDIHPLNKLDVGRRLAGLALAGTYDVAKHIDVQSPLFRTITVEGSVARVDFAFAAGLYTKQRTLTEFLVAGADKRFYAAKAVIDGETVIVSHPSVPAPVAVRYCWSAAPEANVFNRAGLPATPFRSDEWPESEVSYDEESVLALVRTSEPGFVDGFNGKDLTGWHNVNGAPSTWQARASADGAPVIWCSGKPTGLLRTAKQYENFIAEFEFRHLTPGGNAGCFVWSDAIPAVGVPFSRSVEVQVMDGDPGDWYTCDGDIFAIWGARLVADHPGKAAMRSYPTSRRMNPSPLWNHYRIECIDGAIRLYVNGHLVNSVRSVSPRKGYLCLESEGTPIEFRNIRIKELPTTSPAPAADTASADEGFTPLYNGVDFGNWKHTPEHADHWKIADSVLSFDGNGPDLWTEKSYRNFTLIADWRWTGKPTPTDRPVISADGSTPKGADGKEQTVKVDDAGDSGIYLRGNTKSQVNAWCWPIGSGEVYGYRTDGSLAADVRAGVTPREAADAPIGTWNRFIITLKGDRLTVILNGKTVIENAHLPGIPTDGPIGLQQHGSPIEWSNILIRPLPD